MKLEGKGLTESFGIYVIAVGFVAAAYADFPLIAYHFKKTAIIPDSSDSQYSTQWQWGLMRSRPWFGCIFDCIGFASLVIAVLFSSFFAPLVFLGGYYSSLAGMALWGVGMGAQLSVMKAAIADLVPTNRLGFAFGIFNTAFGLFWFAGSVLMGVFNYISLPTLIVFSVVVQLISIPILLAARKLRLSLI